MRLLAIYASLFVTIMLTLTAMLTDLPAKVKKARIRARYESTEAYEMDRDMLAEVMYWENYWNGEKAMRYTGAVVINRAKYCTWCPDTIRGVLHQKGQYSTTAHFFTKKIPDECYDIADDLLLNGTGIPKTVIYQAMFRQGSGVYEKVGTDYFCYGFEDEFNEEVSYEG